MQLIVIAGVLAGVTTVYGHESGHSKHQAKAAGKVQAKSTDVRLLDLPVTGQDGQVLNFRNDVVGDRLAAINFIYTSCTTACPINSAIFERLQEELVDELGTEVVLISISVDPKTDIPQRLKIYASKHHARPGWFWLTGETRDVDKILLALGAYSSDITEHPSMVLIGDGRIGGWTRYYGFPKPRQLLARLHELRATKLTLSRADEAGH